MWGRRVRRGLVGRLGLGVGVELRGRTARTVRMVTLGRKVSGGLVVRLVRRCRVRPARSGLSARTVHVASVALPANPAHKGHKANKVRRVNRGPTPPSPAPKALLDRKVLLARPAPTGTN